MVPQDSQSTRTRATRTTHASGKTSFGQVLLLTFNPYSNISKVKYIRLFVFPPNLDFLRTTEK